MSSEFVLLRDFAVSVIENWETQVELLLKIFHQILRFFKTDSQDCHTFLFELMKQLVLGGQLPPTVRSEGLEKSE